MRLFNCDREDLMACIAALLTGGGEWASRSTVEAAMMDEESLLLWMQTNPMLKRRLTRSGYQDIVTRAGGSVRSERRGMPTRATSRR